MGCDEWLEWTSFLQVTSEKNPLTLNGNQVLEKHGEPTTNTSPNELKDNSIMLFMVNSATW